MYCILCELIYCYTVKCHNVMEFDMLYETLLTTTVEYGLTRLRDHRNELDNLLSLKL